MTARIPSMRTKTRLLALAFLFLAAVGCPGHKKLALPGIFEACGPAQPGEVEVLDE